MAVRMANSAAIAAADAITALVNGGDLRIRDAAQPAQGDDAAAGTVLVTYALPTPAFGGAVDANPHADATANSIATPNASATGTGTYYEVRDSGGTVRWTGTVSTVAAGTGDLQIEDTAITSGNPVPIVSWVFRHLEL